MTDEVWQPKEGTDSQKSYSEADRTVLDVRDERPGSPNGDEADGKNMD